MRSSNLVGRKPLLLCIIILFALASPLLANVSAGPVTRVEIDQTPPLSIDADSQMQFSVTLYDASNSTVSGTIEWSSTNGTIDGAGLFTPWTVGNITITANSGGVSEFVNITVEPGWPATLSLLSNISEVGMDSSVQLTAKLLDARGNEVFGHNLLWSPSQGVVNETGVWTPVQVGNASIEVHWGELSATMMLTVIPGEATVIFLPSALYVRSGQSISITPELRDSFGNILSPDAAGTLQWDAESGTISTAGVFTGSAVGSWDISCTTSTGLSAITQVEVISAVIDSIEMFAEERAFRADEAIEIKVIRTDIYGNIEEVIIPLVNWTYPTGSLRLGENATEWLPNEVGNWSLSVSTEGQSASITIEIIHGYASELLLVAEIQRVSADDDVVIHMQARDIRNNRWVVTGLWETEASAADAWLSSFGTWASFEATTSGEWIITGSWFDDEQQMLFSAELTIDVFAGELALIQLQGGSAVISTDEVIDLSPLLFDADGNDVGTVLLNWSVDGDDRTTDFRLHRGVYYPQSVGLHEIRAQADSAYASIIVEVTPGRARTLTLDVANNLSIVSGGQGEITFTVYGRDLSDNSFLVADLTWIIPDGAGSIRAGTDSGEWILTGHSTGDWMIELYSEDAQYFFDISVQPGLVARIEVILSSDQFHQGDEMIIDVRVFDSYNNSLTVPPSEMQVSSTAGPSTFVNHGSWKILMETGGTDHAVTVRYGDITVQKFFDVQGALLGGALGSSDVVVMSGTLVIALILATLVYVMRRTRAEDFSQVEKSDSEVVTISPPPEAASLAAQPAPSTSSSLTTLATEPSQPIQAAALGSSDKAAESAAMAKASGVMVAAEGTVQGQSGWYYDTSGELTHWEVDAEGRWNRL